MKGYYLVLGNCPEGRDEPASPDERQMRLYWHLTSETAVQLVAAATEILNAASIPFMLKVLRKPITYARRCRRDVYRPAPLCEAERRHSSDLRTRGPWTSARGPPAHPAPGRRSCPRRGSLSIIELRPASLPAHRQGCLAIVQPGRDRPRSATRQPRPVLEGRGSESGTSLSRASHDSRRRATGSAPAPRRRRTPARSRRRRDRRPAISKRTAVASGSRCPHRSTPLRERPLGRTGPSVQLDGAIDPGGDRGGRDHPHHIGASPGSLCRLGRRRPFPRPPLRTLRR